MKKINFLYILRLSELDEAQRFRFIGSFFVAIYLMILIPVIKKYQGVFFTTQLITVLMILQQLSSKFLEKINEKFIIGQLLHILTILQLIEICILFLYFYDFKLMVYLYSFFDILLAFVAMSYGIKLTSLQAKKDPHRVKTIQIFKQNIWAEGFLIGLFLSFGLQYLGIAYVISTAIAIRAGLAMYFIKNWNFFDNYFKEKK